MDTILTPDETWTSACEVDNVTAAFTDTVTVTGDGPLGAAMDTDTAAVTGAPTPVIGVAKRVTSVSGVGGGQVDVALSLVVENLGSADLANVQVTEDLAAAFPAPVTFAVQSGPSASGTLTANAGFDGSGDQNLLTAGASTLAVGASGTITLTVRVDPNGEAGPFQNSVVASGASPAGTMTTDTSDDGADPDPDGAGDPSEVGEDDPTLIALPAAAPSIPTTDPLGAAILVLLLAGVGLALVMRRG